MSQALPFGKYLLLERINVGGMAEVYKAKAFGVEGFERILAVKRILPNMADDEEFINMFIDEARIAVQLGHSNIVTIYELGKFENQYYIAMEYVAGKDLRQILDRFRKNETTMPIEMSAYITSCICNGLDFAHHKRDASGRPLHVIHRDVSPQNILIGYEGAVKITDFGIAKAEDRASKTQAGVLKGKFAYMSPEQVRGLEIDLRSDIFAVGILLYEMLTGKRLFIGESDFATLEKVRNAEVTPPQEHNPKIPDALQAIVLKALAKERDERYQTAAELRDDLQQFIIQDSSVFTGNKLSEILKQEYRSEIDIEGRKNEEFLRLQPSIQPQDLVLQKAHLAAPTGDWSNENREEKTIIFESEFAQKNLSIEKPTIVTNSNHQQEILEHRPTRALDQSMAEELISQSRVGASGKNNRMLFRVALGAALMLFVGVLGIVLYLGGWSRGTATGTLVVTSSPTNTINILLDDNLIGEKTPLTFDNISAGEHRLVLRADGFKEKAYRFDLIPGAPAEIHVVMERLPPAASEASLEVTTDPDMASVRIGGLPQGITPLTLRNPDIAHPIILEVSKTGFITQMVTANLTPENKHQSVHVKLKPTTQSDAMAQNAMPNAGGVSTQNTNSTISNTSARLKVRSQPAGATIYVAGVQKGVTPFEIQNLDPAENYSIELVKEGYRSYEDTVHMRNRRSVYMMATLVPNNRSPRAKPVVPTAACQGSGSFLSVMALNVSDCKVMVGSQVLGVAPLFKKDAPQGRCVIDVRCPGNKHYQSTRVLRAGVEEKIIIRPDEWSQQ